MINVSFEYSHDPNHQYDKDKAFAKIGNIHETMLSIFRKADQDNIPTNIAADRLVEEKLGRRK